MKTAAEYVPAHYVRTARGSTPEPRFRKHWSRLRQLRWKASLIMSDHPGIKLYIEKGRGTRNGIFIYGLFQISWSGRSGGGGMSGSDFDTVWTELNGIRLGLDMAGVSDTEYAVESRTFVDGDFDRLDLGRWRNGVPYSEEDARAEVDARNRNRPSIIARVVQRGVTDWRPKR